MILQFIGYAYTVYILHHCMGIGYIGYALDAQGWDNIFRGYESRFLR